MGEGQGAPFLALRSPLCNPARPRGESFRGAGGRPEWFLPEWCLTKQTAEEREPRRGWDAASSDPDTASAEPER